MHELGIARDLFKIIKEKARENNLKRVTKIRIKLGIAAGIEEDFLTHSFVDHILPGTIAAGAVLELIKEDIEAKCKNCGKEIGTQDEFAMKCPACNSPNIEIMKGKNVYLEKIEGDR